MDRCSISLDYSSCDERDRIYRLLTHNANPDPDDLRALMVKRHKDRASCHISAIAYLFASIP